MKKIYRRDWLNKKEGRAFIITAGDTCLPEKTKDGDPPFPAAVESVDYYLDIGDCNRSISLDFTAYNRESAQDKLAKVNLMMEHLNQIKAELQEACVTLPTKKQLREYNKAWRAHSRKGRIPRTVALAELADG